MNEIILSDNMKKESTIFLIPIVISFVMAIFLPIVAILKDLSDKELIVGEMEFVIIGLFSLYGFLYAIKYNVTVTKEQIQLKTLFRTVILNISDIKEFKYKRYMKSKFYQFKIYYLDKKVMISTRYYKLLDEILNREINSRQEI